MSETNQNSHELLRRYLSGAITAPEEAELERLARTDETLREAMRGLQSAPEEDHLARIERMKARAMQGARPQVQGKDRGKEAPTSGAVVRPITRYRYYAAAAVMLLLVSAVFLLPRLQQEAMAPTVAMKQEVPAEALPEAIASEPVIEQEMTAEDNAQTSPAPEVQTPDPRPRPSDEPAATNAPVAAATPPPPPPAKPAESSTAGATQPEADFLEIAEEEVPATVPAVASSPVPAAVQSLDEEVLMERDAAEMAAKERAKREQSQRRREDAADDRFADMAAATAGNTAPARTLIGRVTTENGEPIFNALVRQPGLPIGQRTDSNGVFQLSADVTATLLDISHPDFNEERVDVKSLGEDLQITLEQDEKMDYAEWRKSWQATKIPLSKMPGYALPEEGYNALRKRIEDNKPAEIPNGKIKLSFLVDPDGTLSDFVFRGQPDQATMDYIGKTIMNTSIWNVVKGEEPVRVYFKVVFE